MKRSLAASLYAALLCLFPAFAAAQDPPPKIGPFAVDVHGTVPRFPSDDAQLALSRGLDVGELPGAGLGLHIAATIYPLKWKVVTFGFGADLTLARSHLSEKPIAVDQIGRAVTERFAHIAPALSFNFGTGDGWSYISGGMGRSTWSLVPDGTTPTDANKERLTGFNYGGGARWFTSRHLAFSLDVRFYAIYPGTPELGRPGGPRTTLLIIGGGISIK